MPMKILVLSREGNGADMATRFTLEGAQTKLCILEQECASILDGLAHKTKDWKKEGDKSDLVFFDDTGMEEQARYFQGRIPTYGIGMKNKDFTVYGNKFHGAKFQDELEKNRTMTQEVFKNNEVGNAVNFETLEFTDLVPAIEHLKTHLVPHVIKPMTQGSGSEKTYVGEKDDNSDAIGWLETLQDRPSGGKIQKIEIEERKKGVEVACSAYFNGHDFVYPVNINFEHKRIATGNIGFNTGEMGTVMYYDTREAHTIKLFRETLWKLGDFLARFDYRGQIDINCIVNDEGIWPLESTPRQGYPASYIECELQKTPLHELFFRLAKGEDFKNEVHNGWAIGVVLAGEGYPFWKEGHQRMDGMPIQGLDKQSIKHLHTYDVKLNKNDRVVCAGCYPLTATSKGETLKEAIDGVYGGIISQVYFPGMYYRTDIGQHVKQELVTLDTMGHQMFMKE